MYNLLLLMLDDTVPTLAVAATDTIVYCDNAGNTTDLNNWLNNYGGASINDICTESNNLTWNNDYDGLGVPALANCNSDTTNFLNVSFTAEDACGNSIVTTARFIIVDDTSPVISLSALDTVVECSSSLNDANLTSWLNNNGGAQALDGCNSDISWMNDYNGTPISNSTCVNDTTYQLIVNFTVSDECGNSDVTSARFIVIDNTAPTITQSAIDTVVACDGLGNSADINDWVNRYAGALANDNCGGSITWDNDYDGNGAPSVGTCDMDTTNRLLVNFMATDNCGNAITTTATLSIIDVIDTSIPTLTASAQDTIVSCVADGIGNDAELQSWLDNNGGSTVIDGCGSGAIPFEWTNDYNGAGIPALTSCLNDTTHILEVVFTATDDCDNTVQTSARFVIIDEMSPSITANALDTIVVCADNSNGNDAELQNWLDNNGGAAVIDGCSSSAGDFEWTNDYNGAGIPALPNCLDDTTHILTVTFTAIDNCDNTAQTIARFM